MGIVLNGTVENSIAEWLMVQSSFQTKRSFSEHSQSQTGPYYKNILVQQKLNFKEHV